MTDTPAPTGPATFDLERAREAAGVDSIQNCRLWLRSACDEIERLRVRLRDGETAKWIDLHGIERTRALNAEAKLAEVEKERDEWREQLEEQKHYAVCAAGLTKDAEAKLADSIASHAAETAKRERYETALRHYKSQFNNETIGSVASQALAGEGYDAAKGKPT